MFNLGCIVNNNQATWTTRLGQKFIINSIQLVQWVALYSWVRGLYYMQTTQCETKAGCTLPRLTVGQQWWGWSCLLVRSSQSLLDQSLLDLACWIRACWITACWISLCWIRACWIRACWISPFWISPCWISLCHRQHKETAYIMYVVEHCMHVLTLYACTNIVQSEWNLYRLDHYQSSRHHADMHNVLLCVLRIMYA